MGPYGCIRFGSNIHARMKLQHSTLLLAGQPPPGPRECTTRTRTHTEDTRLRLTPKRWARLLDSTVCSSCESASQCTHKHTRSRWGTGGSHFMSTSLVVRSLHGYVHTHAHAHSHSHTHTHTHSYTHAPSRSAGSYLLQQVGVAQAVGQRGAGAGEAVDSGAAGGLCGARGVGEGARDGEKRRRNGEGVNVEPIP